MTQRQLAGDLLERALSGSAKGAPGQRFDSALETRTVVLDYMKVYRPA